jgi:DNA/RNA-binding domain of Phe-tRNA-synthetase-like protein
MQRVLVSNEIMRAYPHYRVGVLLAGNVEQSQADHAFIDGLVEDALQRVQSEWQQAKVMKECSGWREVYRQMGLKAGKTPCSLESLYKRAIKGAFPRINPVVDLYNVACLRSALCLGAYDLAAVQGEIEIRYGRGEQMEPIGGGVLVTEARQVVYADARGPLCAYWNHRDAERSKVTGDSTSIVFFADALDVAGERCEAALDELGAFLKTACGTDVRLRRVAAEVKGT